MCLRQRRNLVSGGSDVIGMSATSDFITEALEFRCNYPVSISAYGTNIVGGPPTFQLQGSNDRGDGFVDLSRPKPLNGIIQIREYAFKYVRMKFRSNNTTGGTVTADLFETISAGNFANGIGTNARYIV